MICNQCGSYNPDTATFCGKCGGQLKVAMSNAPQPAYLEQVPSTINNYQTSTHIPPFQSVTPSTPPSKTPWYQGLSKPMPIWALIGSIVLVTVLLVLLLLSGGDWVAGAMRVGIVAGILALIVLLITVVRMLLGLAFKSNPTRLIQLISTGLVILLLSLLCVVGLTQQSAIHNLQAHYWEAQQQWQFAINQYQSSGEGAPTSEDISRVYNLWGEQFTSHQQYAQAVAKYNIVLTYYGSASAGIARAQSDSITAYLAWGQQASQQHDYASATNHYNVLLNLSYCTSTCQSQVKALDATAYYNLAESQLAAKNYPAAVNNFHILVSRFANSTEAPTTHRDYAKALFGEGEQQLKGAVCSSGVPTYQQLSKQFGDTPEGQRATNALKANQPVKGHFIKTIPNDPSLTPVATLIKGLRQNTSDSEFYQLLSTAPAAAIQSNGNFIFSPLPQGSYVLAWGIKRSDGYYHYGSAFYTDGSAAYIASVGPLCPYDFGDINETIPTS